MYANDARAGFLAVFDAIWSRTQLSLEAIQHFGWYQEDLDAQVLLPPLNEEFHRPARYV